MGKQMFDLKKYDQRTKFMEMVAYRSEQWKIQKRMEEATIQEWTVVGLEVVL